MALIYKVVNKTNGKIYIGQTVNTLTQRKSGHYHEAKYGKTNYVFHKALKKYRRKDFEWKVVCKCKSGNVADFLEEIFIKKFNSFYGNGNGYNMTEGGRGFNGRHHSEKTKKLLKEKNSKLRHSKKSKNKISESLKKAYESGERIYKSGMLGKKHSKETKKKIREKTIGNTRGARIWNVIIDGKETTIKNLTEWCEENNYPFHRAKHRIKNNIDLSKKEITGSPKTYRIKYEGKYIVIKNLTKWCRENNYSVYKARYRFKNDIDLKEKV